MEKMEAKFTVNNSSYNFNFSPEATLLDVLRENGFTEVKAGCLEGNCGSCVVLIDDKLVNSCQVLAASVLNGQILTVKGVGNIHNPHPIQIAFAESAAVQCGFCTPAKVLCAYALLCKNPSPSDNEIKEAFNGIICRCTGYVKIIEAVKLAAQMLKKEKRSARV